MEQKLCRECGSNRFVEGGFGLDTCMQCGVCMAGPICELMQYFSTDRVMVHCTYTRRKRFRKYLMRANRNQSANTVPAETWEHLMKFAPFGSPGELHRCLKSAKHIKRKCYDSMPLMCLHLCKCEVPSLDRAEIAQATEHFDVIDQNLRASGESMISYLFCLEFILQLIGRPDMLPFINRIKCATRRQRYRERLSKIFTPTKDVSQLLKDQVRGNFVACAEFQGKNPRATKLSECV